MPDQPYNKEANDLLHTQIFTLLGEIKEQTTEHNHRMTKMEKWRERMRGVAIASGLFMAVVVVPILAWALWLLVKVQGELDHPPATREDIAKALIELRAQAEKLQVDIDAPGTSGGVQ